MFSSLCPLPENRPLSPARRSLFQGTCLLLAVPDRGSMVPAVYCVPLSGRRTSGPETLRSTAACCVSSAVLPSVCWASSGGRSTFWVTWPGAGSLLRPRPLPPLSSFPPWWSPSPVPLCLYFYSLNSAESPAFYSCDYPPTHTHTHTHTHLHTHTPHTHTCTHSYTQTPTYAHI